MPSVPPSDAATAGLPGLAGRTDLRTNDFARDNQFHSAVLLPACGSIV